MSGKTPFVAVGTDGSPEAELAVGWAAERAARLGMDLVLLSADPPEVVVASGLVAHPQGRNVGGRTEMLAGDSAELSELYPDLKVETRLLGGPAAAALLQGSEDAELLVIGTRGLRGLAGILLGSIADQVVANATHPVVVVTDRPNPDGPVVVGLETSPASREAARFAVVEAATRGTRLVVVSALGYPDQWADDRLISAELVARHRGRVRSELQEYLAEDLAAHPDVEVDYRIDVGSPPTALLDASNRATLVVVGTRGRGALTGLLLGSTSRRTAESAHCPVAIIPNRARMEA